MNTITRELTDIPLRSSHHASFPASGFPCQVDQYICPQCEAEIPLAQVVVSDYADRTTRPRDRQRTQVVRRVQVQCPYCKAAFDSGQALEFGAWHCAEIRRMTDAREIAALARKIDAQLGTIRRPAAA